MVLFFLYQCPLVTSISASRHLGNSLRSGSCAATGFATTVFNGAGILNVFLPAAFTVAGVDNSEGNQIACHTCTVLSWLAEAMRSPSGDHATALTQAEWPQ